MDLVSATMLHFLEHAGPRQTQHLSRQLPASGQERARVVDEWRLAFDPTAEVVDLVERFYEEPTRQGRRTAIRRKKFTDRWGVSAAGNATFCGRECCGETLETATRVRLRDERTVRNDAYTSDAMVCTGCNALGETDVPCTRCGAAAARNDWVKCATCGSLYRTERRVLPE